MDREQELEWDTAQKIEISVDLLATAKQQLQFLAAVDRNRWLYEGPSLERAVYRYGACWLPLLAKHTESPILDGCLVVPFDCEWVWHCHRLNPVRYKSDCEELYGRILDNRNVVSSLQGSSERRTQDIWNSFYPNEPYNLNLSQIYSDNATERVPRAGKCLKYDLVSAVKRQAPFFYQVSRLHMNHNLFLEGAVSRYKGFLHIIRRNWERSIKCFCVPTYDIDLIWHSHQLHSASYCKDLIQILGKVLEHDDTDSDRSKGKKLNDGFSKTTKQWEDTFGSRYWRAGAMHRGSAPSPLTTTPFLASSMTKNVTSDEHHKTLPLPALKIVEVMLEFVEVRNLPEKHRGSLSVWFCKRQPDAIFNSRWNRSISSESREKQIACFRCQPNGHLDFEVVSHSSSYLPMLKVKRVGSTSLSLEEFFCPVSTFAIEKWIALVPHPGAVNSKPVELRVAMSFTIPIPAPHVLQIVHFSPFPKLFCFSFRNMRSTLVIDQSGEEVIKLQMRILRKEKGWQKSNTRKEVVGVRKSGEACTFAQFVGTEWSLVESQCFFRIKRSISSHTHLLELIGDQNVKIFPGRKLEYEPKHYEKHKSENDFVTAVDFSAENPYGKALALFDLRLRVLEVKQDWFVLPGVTLAIILPDILRNRKDRVA